MRFEEYVGHSAEAVVFYAAELIICFCYNIVIYVI